MFLKNLGLQKRIKGRTTKEREDIYHVMEKNLSWVKIDWLYDLLLRHKSNFWT